MLQGPSEERKQSIDRRLETDCSALPARQSETEAAVIESLVNRRSDRIISMMQTEEFRGTIGNIAMETVEAMAKTIPDLDLEEFAEGREQIRREIEAALTEPDKMREVAHNNSVNHYRGAERFKEQLEEIRERLLGEDMEAPEVLSSLGRLVAVLESDMQPERRIVLQLTEVATESGIDAATSKEAYVRAVKSAFPTREEFEQYHLSAPERCRAEIDAVVEAFQKEIPEVGAALASMFRSFAASGPLESIRRGWAKAEADDIYGK